MTPTVQSLVDKAAKYDPSLAAEIREFAQSREYGLVFEHNRPERMRLYGKPVKPGDVVQVLPERGKAESAGNKVCWMVESIDDGEASLIMNGRGQADSEHRTASINDLVAVAEYQQPIYAGLKETGRVGNGDPTQLSQIVINGENYHALETLLFAYAGKVDCIYIDPPYNTGAKDWKYNNDYVDDNDQYRHSKWLAMMERRLKLARQLLNPHDSVLIVTIDEKEYLRLGMLVEQVFPNATSIQTVSITINKNGVARGNQFKRADEYAIFVFFGAATPCQVDLGLYSVELGKQKSDSKENRRSRGVRWERLLRGGPNAARTARPNLFYPIYIDERKRTIEGMGDSLPLSSDWKTVEAPDGLRAVWPIRTDGREATWRISQKALQEKLERGCARVGEYDKKADRYSILYLGNIQEERIAAGELKVVGRREDGSLVVEGTGADKGIPTTVWTGAQFSAGEYGSRYNKPNALVLDFFSGSGTTAHAVMRLNRQDSGHRQCICVTNNEVSADEERKLAEAGYRHGDAEWERLGICEYVTKPRIQAAITGRTPDGQPIKGDYKFVDEFPMSDGFKENAVFFDLEYLEPDMVELGLAFEQIAPLLWLRAGSEGRMIREVNPAGFELADTYAVLFDYAYAQDFVEQLDAAGDRIRTVFIVTDDDHRYQMMCGRFPDRDVVRLYESYLQSFRIAAEGAEV